MRNPQRWQPSKYVRKNGKLIASRDPHEVHAASRLVTDLVAGLYDANLKQYARGKLADLGCGKAPLYAAYKELVTDVICADWQNTLHKNEHLDYEIDLTRDLPFGSGEFDTIILSDVLEHIPAPEQLWKEMARILAKNGKIIVNVPMYYWLHEEPHDYYRYTEFGLRRFVEISGLKLLKLETIGGAPEILADILAKNIINLPVLGRPLAVASQWLVWGFIGTGWGRKVSKATAAKFPLGYFLVAEKP